MNFTPTTELEAVNLMLISVNEAPIELEENQTLDDITIDEVILARTILHNISRDIQSIGFNFNSESNYTINLSTDEDTLNYIVVPDNTLKCDAVDIGQDVVLRGTTLYDKNNHTYVFTAPLNVDIVFFLEFDKLPQPARTYITVKAIRTFQRIINGSETMDKLMELEEANAWINLTRDEADSSDFNLLTSYTISNMLKRS